MNKDTVVASIIGFGLGLVAAIALWVVPRVLPKNLNTSPQPSAVSQTSTSASPLPELTAGSLVVRNVKDSEIVVSKEYQIEGSSPKAKYIVVITPTQSQVLTPDTNGNFSAALELNEGNNTIVVHTLGESDDSLTVNVYYYEEAI